MLLPPLYFPTLATGFTLIGVNVSQIVFQRDSLERTNLHTLAATDRRVPGIPEAMRAYSMTSQTRIDAAYAEFGKMGTVLEVDAFLKTVKERFGQQEKDLDKSLWRMQDGKAVYVNDIGDRSEAVAARTYDYARYMNTQTVPEIVRAATAYRNAISSAANAHVKG